MVSAIAWALDGIPIVGGSAGDDLRFRDAVLLHGGRIHRNAAVLVVVETDFAVEIFKSDNFEPTRPSSWSQPRTASAAPCTN